MKTPPTSPTLLATLIALLIIAQTGALAAPADPVPEQQDVIIILDTDPTLTPNVKGPDRVHHLKLHAQTTQQDISQYIQTNPDIQVRGHYWLTNAVHVRATPAAIQALKRRPDVKDVVANIQLTLLGNATPTATTPWGLNKIGASDAWDQGITGEGVTVAVVDTGVDYTHPDLDQNIWTNPGETPGNGIDDDGNGYVDDHRGWDFGDDDNDPMDTNSHGTHVAGTVAGYNDGSGTQTGVAPDATIMPLKVMTSSGSIYLSDLMTAVQYAVDNDADIVSMSIGTASSVDSLTQSYTFVEDAAASGVTVVISAGNEGSGTDTITFPGSEKDAVTVGATDSSDSITSFSSRGPVSLSTETYTKPDVSAPGKSIKSTIPTGGLAQYTIKSGTSMAAPHVSGLAALLLEADPTLTPADIKTVLHDTSLDISSPGAENTSGWGRIRVKEALDALNTSPPATPPTITNLTTSPTTGNGTLTVTATLHAGTGNVSGAEYSIDTSTPYGTGTPLPAADGTYDSPTETISTTLDLTALSDGNHTLHLRAANSAGADSDPTTSTFTIDTTPPTITSTTTTYAAGQTRARPGDTLTLEVTTDTDASKVTLDAAPINTTTGTIDLTYTATCWTTDVTIDTLPTGTYTLNTTATDPLNNTATTTLTVDVDNDNPTATLTSPTDGTTVTGTTTITGTATDPTALHNWNLTHHDGATTTTLASGTSPTSGTLTTWNTSTTTDGNHTLHLTTTDTAGNTANDTVTVTVDNTAPTATITDPTDGQTVTDTITVTGTATDTISLNNWTLTLNDGTDTTTLATGTSSTSGTLTTLDTSTLSDGNATLTLSTTDHAGTTALDTITVYVDNTAPVTSDTTIGYPDGQSRARDGQTLPITVTTSDSSGIQTVTVDTSSVSTQGTITLTDNGDGTWTGTVTPDLGTSGTHDMTVTATDTAGNTNTTTATVQTDNDNPTTTLTEPPTGDIATGTVTVTGATDDPTALHNWTLTLNDGTGWTSLATGTTPINGTLTTWTPSSDGNHTLRLRATDTAGNTASDSTTITVDTTAPDLMATSTYPAGQTTIRDGQTLTIEANATDATTDVTSVSLNSSPISTQGTITLTESGGTWTATATPDRGITGSRNLTITATDTAGNSGTTTISVALDNDAPNATVSTPTDGETVSGTTTITGATTDTTALQNWTLSLNDGTGWTSLTSGTGPVDGILTNWDTTATTDGNVTLRLTATDDAGNTAETTTTTTVDNTGPGAPSISVTYPGNQTAARDDQNITVTITATDPSGIDSVTIDPSPVSTGGVLDLTETTGTWTASITPDRGVTGTFTLAVTITDTVGNTDTTTLTVTLDNDAPTATITDPANGSTVTGTTTITGTATDGYALQNWTLSLNDGTDWTPLATGTSPVDGALTTWNTTTLPDATYELRLTATDDAGNTASDTHTVTMDNTGPGTPNTTLTYPGNQTATRDGQKVTIQVTVPSLSGVTSVTLDTSPVSTQGTITLTESSGTWTGTITPDRGVTGTHDLTITATDAAGNTDSGTSTIHVDNDAPTATITTPTEGATESGTVSITGTTSDPTSTPTWTLTLNDGTSTTSIATGDSSTSGTLTTLDTSTIPDGNVTLTLTTTDEAGNTAQDTVTISVDNTGPGITTTTVNYPDGQTRIRDGQTLTVSVTTTDTSGIQTITIDTSSISTQGTITLTESAGTWTGTITPDLTTSGTYDLTVTATDTAGNTGTTTIPIATDNDAPTSILTAPTNGQIINGTITITGTATDPTALHNWTLTLNDGTGWTTLTTGTSPVADSTLDTWTPSADGNCTLRLTATDEAGNTTETRVNVTVDTTETSPPRVTSITTPTGWTRDNTTVAITVTATDPSGIHSVTLDTSPVSTHGTLNLTESNSTWTGTLTPDLGTTGTYDLALTVTDTNGNSNTSATATIRLDNDDPSPVNNQTATDVAGDETGKLRLTWSTATDLHSGLAEYRIYTSITPFTDTAEATLTATTTGTSLNLTGTTGQPLWIAVVPVDQAENTNTSGTPIEATPLDDVAPRAENITPANNSRTRDHTPNITADLVDASPIDTTATTLLLDGTNVTLNATPTETSINYTPTTPLAKGTHTATLTATDTAGNRANYTWTFEVYGNDGSKGSNGGDGGNKGGNGGDNGNKGGNGGGAKKDTTTSSGGTGGGGGGSVSPSEDPDNIQTRQIDFLWSIQPGEKQKIDFTDGPRGKETPAIVRRVGFVYDSIADDVKVDLQELRGPTTVRDQTPPGTVYRHFNLYVDLPLKTRLTNPKLELAVDQNWLDEQGGNPDNLRLATWDTETETWLTTPLQTTATEVDHLILTAQPPQFSQYALTYVEPDTPSIAPETPQKTITQSQPSLIQRTLTPENTPTRQPLQQEATERPPTTPAPGLFLTSLATLTALFVARRE